MTATSRVPSPKKEEWIDISDNERLDGADAHERSASLTGSSQGSTTTSARRRKPGTRKIFIAAPKPPTSSKSASAGSRRREQLRSMSEDVSDALFDGGIESARYTASIVRTSLRLMKHPLALLLFLWLFAWIVDLVSHSLRATLMPICSIPGLALLCPAFFTPGAGPHKRASGPPQWADFPRLFDVQDRTLETLLDETVDGSGLSLEVKKAEMATADLVTLVRVSDLTSRDRLAEMLVQFANDARETARLLQRFSAQVAGTVDSVIGINDHALRTIQAASDRAGSLSTNIYALVPFIRHSNPGDDPERVVKKAFSNSMDVLADSIGRLLLEANGVMSRLDRLEARLGSIHELVSRESADLADAREELLALLWTKLGGNARTLRGMEIQRALLGGVGAYRTRALAHVVATIQTLDAHQADMEVLRERVAAPALTGDSIPVEAHVRSIGAGLKRLQERSERAETQRMRVLERSLNAANERTLDEKA